MKYVFCFMIVWLGCWSAKAQIDEACPHLKDSFEQKIKELEAKINQISSARDLCIADTAKIVALNQRVKKMNSELDSIKKVIVYKEAKELSLRAEIIYLEFKINEFNNYIKSLKFRNDSLTVALEGMTTSMLWYLQLYTNEVNKRYAVIKDIQEAFISKTMVVHTLKRARGFGKRSASKSKVILDGLNSAQVVANAAQRREHIYLDFSSKMGNVEFTPIQNTTYTIKKAGVVMNGVQRIPFSGEQNIVLSDALRLGLESNTQFTIEVEYEVDGQKRKIEYHFIVN